MPARSLFTPDNILVPLESNEKYKAIEELADFQLEKGHFKPGERDLVINALFERERSMSTGLEHGVALPHATVDFIDDVKCALGIHPWGLDFDSVDGSSTRIVAQALVPVGAFAAHARTLSQISRMFSEEKLRTRLAKSKSPKEAANIIAELFEG